MKVCTIAILGRPNVGKSSLINKIVNYDVSIVTDVPQTTRDQIIGVYNDENYQLIFIVTPGIHKPLNLLGKILNKNALDSIKDVDLILFLSPSNEEIGKGDQSILEEIKNFKSKIAVISKIDLSKSPLEIADKIELFKNYDFEATASISINNEKSIVSLINQIKTFAYESDLLYEKDFITDKSMRFLAKEIIREGAILSLRQELPHSIAVEITDFVEENERIEISAIIYVKKQSQKGMVIGKNAEMIKRIGILARKKLENQFQVSVNLNLKVKVAEKWLNNEKTLEKLGY